MIENGDHVQGTGPPSYAEAFPPLSSIMAATSGSQAPQSAWPVKSIRSTTVTQVFHVPLEERRFQFEDHPSFGGETRQSEIIRDIKERTGCEIEMSMPKDRGLTIMVTGKPSVVVQARREILTKLQTQAHVDLKIPKEHHKFIIGREGSKLKTIELATATKISFPRTEDSSDIIRIMGTREGVDKARHQLQTISDEQAKLGFERLEVEKEFHPFIQGPNGSVAKSIMEQTGARINIPPPSLMKNEITVAGDKDSVAKAVAQIRKMHENLRRTCSTVPVEVRKSQHKYIVGPRGQGLQEVLQSTGVWVEVPAPDADVNTITLRGPQEKLGQALTQVYEKANSVVIESVHAPHWLHRFIIGRKGQNVQKITQDLPKVHVEFNSDLDKIILEGPPEQVQLAKESFETFTEDLMATMDFAEIHVEQKYHRHIIGKGGASVNKIKTETGTSIIIPPDEEKSDVIRIEGDPKGVAAAKTMLLDMAAKMENERTKDIIIDQRFHRQIIGAKGEKIKEIRDRFNGIQVAFPDPGEKKDVVTLRGPKEDVDKCFQYLKKMAAELAANNYRQQVKVFKKFHGTIIGKGGATLRKIREETDTKIELPPDSSASDIIVITGRKENVEKACSRIKAIEKEMASVVDLVVPIPRRLHNSIIGPKGKLIRAIMDECGGVRIHFPPSESTSDEVRLHGPRDDVDRAKSMLLELVDEQALNNHSLEIRCKPEYHRFLIGRGGANIRKVRDEFGARVIFPQKSSDDDAEAVTIIGRKEKAEAARDHLLKLIKDLDNIVEVEMCVDPKYHRHFIQRRGQLIHEISEENGRVIISFPRSGTNSDKVILKGAKQCVSSAKAHIEQVIEDLEAQVTIECVIEQRQHRSIMGPKGSNVQGITQEHNVSIKFPDRDPPPKPATNGDAPESPKEPEPRNIIRITGRLENAQAAKQALLDLIPIDVEVEIPNEFHRYIIGQRGREIRGLMDEYDVGITVPSSDKRSDIITINGPRKNCEEARQALERRRQELEAEKEEKELRSFQVSMQVDPKYHPNIIGRKGATINKIRDDHDVRIQLPDKDGPNADEITIMGYEHQVKAAQDDIMKIVQELEEQISEEIEIDHRVHSRLIGQKGKAIAKVMERFKVDIRFPRDKQSSTVVITGLEENVEDAKEHLYTVAEDYMQDVIEKAEEQELLKHYTVPKQGGSKSSRVQGASGYVVSGAPWNAATEEFPAIGAVMAPKKTQWGPSAWGPKLPK